MENKDVEIHITGVSMFGKAEIKMNTVELLKRIKKKLREQKSAIAEKMIEGRETDFQSYQKDVGLAQGLEAACAIIDETLTKIDEED